MKPQDYYDGYDINTDLDLAGYSELPKIRNMPRFKAQNPTQKARPSNPAAASQAPVEISNQDDRIEQFNFSYHASRHEQGWLIESLGNFYNSHWIKDVLSLVKGGKEASVYLCTARPAKGQRSPYLAAKVYRPRKFRNLRKDHLYREGRHNLDIDGHVVLDNRMNHAMQQRTRYGQELLHTSWIGHEYKTMQILHTAGVDLPAPIASDNNAILMTYLGSPEMPAPTLNTIELERDEAESLFERIVKNIDLMLGQQRVHGDLSAYNVLYWEGQIALIDFPQAIDPQENRNAFRIFERDVRRICEYFASQGVPTDPGELARQLWTAHGYRLKPDVHPRLLNDEDEQDRQYWQSIKNGDILNEKGLI